ncbi:CocE/NonD family hydrolase [Virgibacillus sp. FSP13]
MTNETFRFEENVACTLSDGTVLRSDVYRPNDEGNYPVLMIRLPYDKKTPRYFDEYLEVPRMVEAGYVVILQDVRGRFASEGDYYPFIHEGSDGYESVEWAAKLPYANGKVGLFGMSYHGYTQLAAAVEKPPSLKAIAPVMTMADPWEDMLNGQNGASGVGNFETWTLGSIVSDQLKRRNDPKRSKVQNYIANMTEWLSYTPANDWPPMKDLDPESFFFDVMHEKMDPDYITKMQLNEKLHYVEIPALFMGGWFDSLLKPTLKAYNNYNGPRMLWIGPWTHEEMSGRAGEKFFEHAAKNIGVDQITDPTEIHIKWFDRWLKDKPMPVEKPVQLYRMGQTKWEAYEEWPPASMKKELFLHSKGESQTRDGDGQLLDVPAMSPTASMLKLDPAEPVPTRGGRVLIAGHQSGMFEIGDIQDREDVLVYTGLPLEENLNMLGTVTASIWVTSPTSLMDLAIRLSDVEPSGNVFPIMDTYHRENVSEIGQPFCIHVDVGNTAYQLKKGHRLRVDLAASNAPLYDVNLNTGQTTKTASSGKIAFEQVHHGGAYSSKVVLPVTEK